MVDISTMNLHPLWAKDLYSLYKTIPVELLNFLLGQVVKLSGLRWMQLQITVKIRKLVLRWDDLELGLVFTLIKLAWFSGCESNP